MTPTNQRVIHRFSYYLDKLIDQMDNLIGNAPDQASGEIINDIHSFQILKDGDTYVSIIIVNTRFQAPSERK